MLKVESLEISGFKSFVDPVTIELAGGITAIVGPNGCGKSNLSEAMTWVLGEQSAKSLRGGSMEDVIFNGAESRKPLGMAECTLTLRTDPSSPAFPRAEEGRITIGRRVFRGGDSQYRLNGKVVRLKDVKDLLMDTGLGIRAYSVIEQGRIGMILSGKPQERRKLLEEAAGITRYKARKNIAEIKLQEATANLLRIDDVVSEVERALRSLKRQASAARRYQEKEREYRGLLARVLHGRHRLQSARLAELRSRLAAATAREAAIAADLHRDEAALAAGRERLEELASEVASRHQRVADLAATIQGRQELIKANRQTLGEIGERAAQDRALAERREQETAGQAEALAAIEQRRGELVAERTQAAAALDAEELRIAAAERDLAEVGARVEALRGELLPAAAALAGLRQRLQQSQIEIERGNFRQQHLEEELARRAHELGQAAETLAIAREHAAVAAASLAARAEEQQRVAAALDATLRREAEAAERKRGLDADLGGARQRQRLLADLARAHVERRGALLAALADAGLAAPEFLAEQAHAALGWERSLDVYLGALADAVVLPAGASALALARALAGRSRAILVERPPGPPPSGATAAQVGAGEAAGRGKPAAPSGFALPGAPAGLAGAAAAATLTGTRSWSALADPAAPADLAITLSTDPADLADPADNGDTGEPSVQAAANHRNDPTDPTDPIGPTDPIEDPAVVLSLGEALRLPADLAAALPPAFLVRSAADAERLARSHPGVSFLSREGVWVQAGAYHVEGETVTPGVLEREGELAALEQSIPELAAERDRAAAELDQLVARRAALAGDANRLQNETSQLRQELAVGRAREEDAAARHRRLAAESETLTVEQQETLRELERAGGRRSQAQLELAEAERRHAALDEGLARAALEQESARGAREALRTASAGHRSRVDLFDERLLSHDREVERLAAEVANGRRQVAAWREEADRLAARRGQLEAGLARAEAELQQALEQRDEAEDEVLAEQEALDAHRQEVRDLDERIARHRGRRDEVRAEIEELRVAGAGLRQDAEHLALTYREHFGEELPALASTTAAAPAPGAPLSPLASPAPPALDAGWPAGPPPPADAAAPAGPADAAGLAIPADPAELAELEAELARCKAALERLGPVNVLAVQEHDEQEERQRFLTTQRADVAQSVDSLRRTIREINEASSERFRATFDLVNQSFGTVFARLFRGGEAEMRLMDDEDVLESGIEIVARPPGKRLQNLMLLSGGEKALTAIALLFALFQTKPSPFCILDEVDAPLDDVNTVRFVDLLRELAGETQFIIITHNKLTMEVAGCLYGVTMEEKGVSKLVAVQLDDVQPAEPRRATA
jgi:chromosome segregation protein